MFLLSARMSDFVDQQVARLHEQQLKATGAHEKDTSTTDAMLLLAFVGGFVGGTSLFVYFTAVQLGEDWDDVSSAKAVEACALMALVISVTSVLLWHICTSQHAGDLLGEVLPGAQHITSTLQSGRIFFFRRYWFKLQPPELEGKSFQLQYFLTQFADEYTERIFLMPQKFQVRAVKQPRPGRPHAFRLDGTDADTGKEFKYVFACRTKTELQAWRGALQALSKADPTKLSTKGFAKVDLEKGGVKHALSHDGWMELEATASQKANAKVDVVKERSDKAIAQQAVTVGALEDENCTLWVGSIPESHVTEDCMYDLLGKFGDIVSVTLRVKPASEYDGDAKRSWAFVTYAEPSAVSDAIAAGAHVFGRSSMTASAGAKGHPLRLRRANVSSELKKKSGSEAEGALQGIADEHKLGKVGMHSYAQSMLDAVQVLPAKWKFIWSVGAIIIVVTGCTVLVAIPGSFFLPLVIWTPIIMKLGAPDDAAQTLREKRNDREGVSPRTPGGGGGGGGANGSRPRALASIRIGNPIHNMSTDSLSVSKQPPPPLSYSYYSPHIDIHPRPSPEHASSCCRRRRRRSRVSFSSHIFHADDLTTGRSTA